MANDVMRKIMLGIAAFEKWRFYFVRWSGYSCAVEIWKIVVKNNTCIPSNNYYNNY